MNILAISLIMLCAVLLSAVINQLFPKIALPLVQAGLGLIAALVIPEITNLAFDPDLFLVLFIAPLLFLEAKSADLKMIVKEIKPIFSLAVLLVVVSMLVLGIVLHSMIPAISLSLAVALGAALGPTDAVAVSSLSKTIKLPKWEHGIMEGEMLFNDASGIVGFQCALLVATTGEFLLSEALLDFAIEFFGGIVFGLLCGYVFRLIVERIRKIGVDNTTFYVLYEVFVPFIIYLASCAIGVSGIIAVVVAGLFKIVNPKKMGRDGSRFVIASSSVWSVLSYTLNGIVFVLLGTQLPKVFTIDLSGTSLSAGYILLVIVVLTIVLFLVRFIWVYIMEKIHFRKTDKESLPKDERSLSIVRRSIITSLTGAKGAVTLSIMFTIPLLISSNPDVPFPNRDLLILIASGVIVLSLLVSIYVVPLFAPKKETSTKVGALEKGASIEILKIVARTLSDEIKQSEDAKSAEALMEGLKTVNDIIKVQENDKGFSSKKTAEVSAKAIDWEEEYLLAKAEEAQNGTIEEGIQLDEKILNDLLAQLDKRRNVINTKSSDDHVGKKIETRRARRKSILSKARTYKKKSDEEKNLSARLQCEMCKYAIGKLEEEHKATNSSETLSVLVSYQNIMVKYQNISLGIVDDSETYSHKDACEHAFEIAVNEVEKRIKAGELDQKAAKEMKDTFALFLTALQS